MAGKCSGDSGCQPGEACTYYQHIEDVGRLVLLGWRRLH
jgi:hypothetical protein